ncbi:MAG: trypsin-like peptidase domain-containing protein, partial [Actinomycetota bacterium]|nr:trypsin-like peptidase domain-containing protein [Actinomycetota bacterium]
MLGAAPCDDLAVVELPRAPDGLKAMPFAEGDVKPGQDVTALGYPGTAEDASGDQGPGTASLTFTDGRVSQPQTAAIGEELGISLPSAILHQAPVNSGNSGGPLVDDFGKLVGWNVSPFDPELVEAMFVDSDDGLEALAARDAAGESEGILVLGNEPDCAAEKAELVFGDFVTEMDDTPVATPADVCDILDSATP